MEKVFNYQFIVFLSALIVSCASSTRSSIVYSGTAEGRSTDRPIVLIGDTQATGWIEFWRENNDDVRGAILDKVAAINPAFVLHVGDIVFQGSSARHWEEFDSNAREIHKRGIPVFPLLGNHEYFGNNASAHEHFFQRFPAAAHRQWYSFRFDSLAFIMLNSNFSEMSDSAIHSQSNWYTAELQRLQHDSTVSVIIAACHHPPFTNSTVVEPDTQVYDLFVRPFVESRNSKTTLFLSGHCHSYEHFEHAGRHFVVTGGGGGPRQAVELSSKRAYTDKYSSAEAVRPLHFCTLTYDSTGLLLHMICIDKQSQQWSECDSFRLR